MPFSKLISIANSFHICKLQREYSLEIPFKKLECLEDKRPWESPPSETIISKKNEVVYASDI